MFAIILFMIEQNGGSLKKMKSKRHLIESKNLEETVSCHSNNRLLWNAKPVIQA